LAIFSMSQDPPGILYEFWRRLVVLLGLACANSDMLSASQFTPACLAAARSCCSRFCFADSMRLRHLSTPVAESEKSDGFEFRSAILSGTEVSAAGCSCVLRKAANALAFRSAFFFCSGLCLSLSLCLRLCSGCSLLLLLAFFLLLLF